MNHKNSCGQHSHRLTHRSRSRFSSDDAAYRNIYSTNRLCSCDFHNRSWNIRRCGRMPFGYVDWKKNCSTSRSSCCGWHNHSPSRRSFGRNLCADADWTNTAPTSHSYSCDRLCRWFRSWSDRRHKNSFCSHCWCRLLFAHFAIPMCGCHRMGTSNCLQHRYHDSYRRNC